MDIDHDVARWTIEFFLQQPLDAGMVNSLVQAFPLVNNNPGLRKKLLLREIESGVSNGSVSEELLSLLEIFEENDFKEGFKASQALKAAYCAVAVDCTVRVLKNGGAESSKGDYYLAVKNIWKQRICSMEKDDTAGLISEELLEWRDRIEAALWEASSCETVMIRSEWVDAVEAVKAFVKEEREKIGPSFLEYMAETIKSDTCAGKLLLPQNVEKHDQIGQKNKEQHDQIGEKVNKEQVQTEGKNDKNQNQIEENDRQEQRTIGEVADFPSASKDLKNQNNVRELQNGKSKLKQKHVAQKRTKALLVGTSRGVKITDNDDSRTESSRKEYNLPATPDVNEAQKALKTSSMELHAVVKDPLPDALRIAASILSSMNEENTEKQPVHDKQPTQDPDKTREIQTNEGNVSDQCGRQQANAPKRSLMERNSTAHVMEWGDTSTAGVTEEESQSQGSRPRLSSPRTRTVSPLNEYEDKKITKRRKLKRWSVIEEETLRTGVQKFGRGNWKLILNAYRDIFEERTEVDLKDKWRNMTR